MKEKERKIILKKRSVFVSGATVNELENIQLMYDGELDIAAKKGGVTIFPPPGESPADLALDIGEELKVFITKGTDAPLFIFRPIIPPSKIIRA